MTGEQLVRIMCPSLTCRRILAVPVSSRGKNVRCKNCGAMIKVPDKGSAVPAAKPESDEGAEKSKSSKPAA